MYDLFIPAFTGPPRSIRLRHPATRACLSASDPRTRSIVRAIATVIRKPGSPSAILKLVTFMADPRLTCVSDVATLNAAIESMHALLHDLPKAKRVFGQSLLEEVWNHANIHS